jgi:hypothetical protein
MAFPLIGAGTLALRLLGHSRLHRAPRVWVFGVYGFHVGVLLTMAIAFPTHSPASRSPALCVRAAVAWAAQIRRFSERTACR